jgi:hypothetical protein
MKGEYEMDHNLKWTDPSRKAQICDKALELIAELVYRGESPKNHREEMYSYLAEELGMTNREIHLAGFDCLLESNYVGEEIDDVIGKLLDFKYCIPPDFENDEDGESHINAIGRAIDLLNREIAQDITKEIDGMPVCPQCEDIIEADSNGTMPHYCAHCGQKVRF